MTVDKVDLTFYIKDEAEKCTSRFIASFLSTYEALVGHQDPEVSRTVKDTMNTAKRILVSKLTGVEIESRYAGTSERQPPPSEGSAS